MPFIYTTKLDLTGLKVLKVEMNIEWAMMAAYFREYMEEVKGSKIYQKFEKKALGCDEIFVCIANDHMYRVVKHFFDMEITDVALTNSLSALDLGYQYVCKTPKACEQLEITAKKKFSPIELAILRDKSIKKRQEGIELTETALLKYRRTGKFFDEILRGI